jgi:hypothetical protein
MDKLRFALAFAVAGAGAAGVAALVPAVGLADKPVVSEHFSFTSDPYQDNLCGVDVTAVDRVVESFKQDESGAFVDNLNLTTTFTAANGKSVQFHQTGAQKASAPIDNGDGTFSVIFKHSGASPVIKVPNGPALAESTGTAAFLFTLDSATGDIISFEVLRASRPDQPGACDAIVAALADP